MLLLLTFFSVIARCLFDCFFRHMVAIDCRCRCAIFKDTSAAISPAPPALERDAARHRRHERKDYLHAA